MSKNRFVKKSVHYLQHIPYFLIKRYNLQPQIIISYDREAFIGEHGNDLRITIDRNLKYFTYPLDPTFQHPNGKYIFPVSYSVPEVKFNEFIPKWLCSYLNSADLQMQRISKYCHGINWKEFSNTLL